MSDSGSEDRGFESRRGHKDFIQMKTIFKYFRDAKPLAQAVGLCFLLVLGFIFASGIQMVMPAVIDGEGAIRLTLVTNLVSQLAMFLLPALLFAWVFHGSAQEYFRFDFSGRKWVQALVAVVILVLLVPINDWITWWNDRWNLGSLEESIRGVADQSKAMIDKMLSLTGPGDFVFQLLVVAFIPALCEEIFFRGSFQQVMQKWTGNPHVAIAVTSLLFSLAHGDLYGFVPRLFLGMVLGYLFYLSGSIIVNICVHFFNNAIVVLMYLLYHKGVLLAPPDAPLLMPWITVVICTLASVCLFVQYFVKQPKK